MKSHQIQNSLILLLTAVIWGTAFVAQSVAMDYIEPFTFNAVRFLIGGTVLLPVIFFMDRSKKKRSVPEGKVSVSEEKAGAPEGKVSVPEKEKKQERKTLWLGGTSCGLLLCVASALQQFGIIGTSTGKTGFITAFYIILVPVFGIFMHKKAGAKLWLSVAVAVVGLYLLCMTDDSLALNRYDVILLLCAATFALHILCVDHFSPRTDGVKLSCIQFYVTGVLSFVMMCLTESPDLTAITGAWKSIAYTGVMSCGVAYTLQVIGQKDLNPVIASLIMSLESVVSAIAGWLILDQRLTGRETAGCVVMFAAIVLAQLPSVKKSGAPKARGVHSAEQEG